MENILLVKGSSQYDAMRIYVDELALAFRKMGYNTFVLDACLEGIDSELEVVQEMNFKFCMNFNAIGLEKKVDFYSPNAVNCTYLCDHPASHSSRISNADDNDLVLVCDANFKKYIQEYFPNIKKCDFVPLSGSFLDEDIPYEERRLDVVFTGTYTDPVVKKQQILEQMEESLRGFTETLMELIILNPDDTIEMCVQRTLDQFGIDEKMSKQEFHQFVRTFMAVDGFARVYYRDKIIRTIVEAGIDIHVYGNGWENFDLSDRENFHIEIGNAYLAQKAVANAKISLNVMPWFKSGFQERIASAMLSGTVALTDTSEYIDNHFVDGQDLVLYSLKELDKLPDIIENLLNNTERAKEIAHTGKKKAQNEHTWFDRAKKIIELVNQFQGVEGMKTEIEKEGEELQLTEIERYIPALLSDCIEQIEKLVENCRQIRKLSYYTYYDVFKIQKDVKRLVDLLNVHFKELDIDTFVFANTPKEIESMFADANLAGGILENYLQNIFGQILALQYDSLWNQLEDQNRMNESLKAENLNLKEKNTSMILNRIYRNYSDSEDEYMQLLIKNIVNKGFVDTYNYDYVNKYLNINMNELCDLNYDAYCGMFYVNHKGKRLYYPKEISLEMIYIAYRFGLLEQDPESPHCYLSDDFEPKEGDVVIDAGVAEGNFSIEIVDRVSKLYLIECEPKWIPALKKTFEPYGDKVVIVEKFLGSVDDEEHITIDTIVGNQQVNFIKMDVEGAEIDSLCGAHNTLKNSKDLKLAVCSYHRKGDEALIKEILEQYGIQTSTTKGYMFFKDDLDSLIDGELRRGIVRGIKE